MPRQCRMLVLAPTRELASQIADNARHYAKGTPLSVATHGLHENASPTIHEEPGGLLDATDCEFTSLPQIFRRRMSKEVSAPQPPLPVFVDRRAGGRAEAPMPRFGCAGTQTNEEIAQ